MKRIVICTILASLTLSKISAQEDDPGWGIKFSGFVKTIFSMIQGSLVHPMP